MSPESPNCRSATTENLEYLCCSQGSLTLYAYRTAGHKVEHLKWGLQLMFKIRGILLQYKTFKDSIAVISYDSIMLILLLP
jgi:hypothetical protein